MTRWALLTWMPPTAVGPAGLTGAAGAGSLALSRTMSLAGLSVRRPTKEAWRIWPSGVHSANSTSATRRGSTQRSLPATRRDQRPGLAAPAAKGGCCRQRTTIHPVPSAIRYLSVLTDFGTDDLLAFLDAQEQSGNAHLLAEPNIITANRELATFLAGGEIPIPIVQSSAGSTGGVSIQYKEYGVRLRFTPEIVSDSLIKLQVVPEVSSLDFVNALLLQGFRVPALLTRRMESTVDVKRNTSLVLSGLFNNSDERVKTGVPILMNIPILGQLFSSTRFQRNESELIVIVTPTIVDPLRPRPEDVMRLQPDTTKPAVDALKRRLPPNQRRP